MVPFGKKHNSKYSGCIIPRAQWFIKVIHYLTWCICMYHITFDCYLILQLGKTGSPRAHYKGNLKTTETWSVVSLHPSRIYGHQSLIGHLGIFPPRLETYEWNLFVAKPFKDFYYWMCLEQITMGKKQNSIHNHLHAKTWQISIRNSGWRQIYSKGNCWI